MNIYTYKFTAMCPSNNLSIEYCLKIETAKMVMVEEIKAVVSSLKNEYHEVMADELYRQLGGNQVMTARHHGVDIETRRGS